MHGLARKTLAAAALFAAGVACAWAARSAVGAAPDDHPMMRPADKAIVMLGCEAADMKRMAADPRDAAVMAHDLAKLMVMDDMARRLAADPGAMRAAADAMADPGVLRVHADAHRMAADPAQATGLEMEVMADPTAIKVVIHRSMAMGGGRK